MKTLCGVLLLLISLHKHQAFGKSLNFTGTGKLLIVQWITDDSKKQPICDNGFTIREAAVACRQNNHSTSHVQVIINTTGQGKEGIVPASDRICRGHETTLYSCYSPKPGRCRRGYVEISCTDTPGPIQLKVYLDKNDIKAYNGSNITVTCIVRAMKTYSGYWYKWTLGNRSIGHSPVVTILLQKKNDGELLKCQVYHRNASVGTTDTTLNVFYPPPAFTKNTVTVMTGASLDLATLSRSESISNPAPSTYSWGRLTDYSKFDNGNKPVLRNMQKGDSGRYLVFMTNQMNVTIGRKREGHGTRVVQVNVIDVPALTCHREMYVLLNETLSMSCAKNFSSGFKVTWYKDDNKMKENNTITTDRWLKQNNVTYRCNFTYSNMSIDGESVAENMYTCNTTIYTIDSPAATLNVHEGRGVGAKQFKISDEKNWAKLVNGILQNETWGFPNITKVTKRHSGVYVNLDNTSESYRLEVMYKPNVTCRPKVLVERGSSQTITCEVDSNPQSTVQWKFSNKTISEDHVYTIHEASIDNNGVYVCEASNVMDSTDGMSEPGNDTCETTVVIYETGDFWTVVIVCAVFSLIVLLLVAAVIFLARKVWMGKKKRGRSDSGISLPMKSDLDASYSPAKGGRKGPLPQAPSLPPPSITEDLQQDVYENT